MPRRHWMYILPNLFTLSSLYCGLLAILWSSTAEGDPRAFFRAAVAVFFAGVFDMMDGRVARLTRTQSDIGLQLDSLADVVSFGVAPAVLVYHWGLSGVMVGSFDLGFFLCFAYAATGALRLARFNVLAMRTPAAASKFFVGLPIPAAAAVLAALVVAHHQTQAALFQKQLLLLLLMPLLSWLMVSTVHFPTFKHVQFSRRRVLAIVAAVSCGVLLTVHTAFGVTVVVLLTGYIGYGLLARVKRSSQAIAQRRRARRAHRSSAPQRADAGAPPDPPEADGE